MRGGLSVCVTLVPFFLLAAQEQESTRITIETVEGDGAINSIQLHRAHEPVVRVSGPSGQPLAGATVTFLLPASGPSGTFVDSGLSLTTQTDKQGRAVGRGLRPNAVVGRFQMRVTASWHGSEAATTLAQTNAGAANKSSATKWIVIAGVVAGAAVAGSLAVSHGGSGSNTGNPATIPSGSISVGTPSFGPPH
jgi:hypothetical protein